MTIIYKHNFSSSQQVISMFKGCKAEDMPPHIYAAAQKAYRHMLSARTDQSLVLMGRSGGGKSTSVRHLMHYFTGLRLFTSFLCVVRGWRDEAESDRE